MSVQETKVTKIARYFLGASFVVFGLNFFLGFLKMPPPASEQAGAFLGALFATGYMFPWVKITEVVAGAFLLSGRLVPFALVLLAPIVLNILAFHLALDPAGAALSVALTAATMLVAWGYREVYRPLFAARPAPKAATRVADRAYA